MTPSKNGQPNGDVVDRYRQAAEVALEQLEWTIRYLERIRKPEIARRPGQKPRAHPATADRPPRARQPDKHTSET